MAETSPSFTVTMNDGKSAKPEQPVPEPASKDMTWTERQADHQVHRHCRDAAVAHRRRHAHRAHVRSLLRKRCGRQVRSPRHLLLERRPGRLVGHGQHRRLGPASRAHQYHQAAALPHEARGQSLLASAHDRPGVPGRHGHRLLEGGRGLRPEEGLGRRRRR